jgi:hypothetical protein
MVRVETPPWLMVEGLKALLTMGGASLTVETVRVAEAGPVLLPLLVCNALAGIVLVKLQLQFFPPPPPPATPPSGIALP